MLDWMRRHTFTSLDLSCSSSVMFPEMFPLLRKRLADCANLHALVLIDMQRYNAIISKHAARLLKNNPTGTIENVIFRSDEEREHYLELHYEKLCPNLSKVSRLEVARKGAAFFLCT